MKAPSAVTRGPRVAAAATSSLSRLVVPRFLLFVLVTIGLCAPRLVFAETSATDPDAANPDAAKAHTKARKHGSKPRHHVVKPEKIYLEEDTPTPAPSASSAADDSSPNPATPLEPVGPTAHVSLETSGYMDTDHVNVLSPSISGGVSDAVAGWSVSGHYLVDVVSAASVDIVSTASPHWTEVRHAGSATASATFEPVTLGALGVVSREPDYLSLTAGATLGFDLFEKNLSPYFAASREADSVGRTDLPHEYWREKQVTSLQVGLTIVLGRASIASLQWDGSFERGSLAKPYRYLPLFAPGQASLVGPGASIEQVNRLRLDVRPSEQLPTARDRHALSGHLAHRYSASTLRLDERLYTDSWGLLASTSEFRYFLDVGRRLELWPHFRFHVQSRVSFWQRAYEAVPGPGGILGVPVLRTGDRELGPLQTIVLGAGARLKLTDSPRHQWDLVLEADVGRTHFSDALYITERRMGYTTLAIEAQF